MDTPNAVRMLGAPQALTVIYVAVIWIGLPSHLWFLVTVALIINAIGGLQDLIWIVRRVTWPNGTLMVVTDDGRELVSFPKEPGA